jgi:hypothetical protein
MNKKIDDVITKDIEAAEIVIDGKAEIRKRTLPSISVSNPLQALFNILPGKSRNLNGCIRNDI